MGRKELIQYILEYDPSYDEEELNEMSTGKLNAIYKEINDDSDMHPNGRDYDAEDEG